MDGHRSRVYPRSAINVRKSGKPDLRVRDAAHERYGIWIGARSRLLTMRPRGTASASNSSKFALEISRSRVAPVSYAVGSKQYLAVQSSGRHVHAKKFDNLESLSYLFVFALD